MNYAYIRVSTELQSYEGQRFEIEKWCGRSQLTIDVWVLEKVSGTMDLKKRTLGRTLRKMHRGDFLICTELSRLGRNMMMVMSILNNCSEKGIQVRSIKDGFELSDSIQSKILAFAFSMAAEIERTLISQRTKEALAAKKAAGIKLGRPSGKSSQRKRFDSLLPEILRMREQGASFKLIAKFVGIHENTLYRYLKGLKEVKNE